MKLFRLEQESPDVRRGGIRRTPIISDSDMDLRQEVLNRLAKRIEDYERIYGDRWIADDIRFALEQLLVRYPNLIRPKELINGD